MEQFTGHGITVRAFIKHTNRCTKILLINNENGIVTRSKKIPFHQKVLKQMLKKAKHPMVHVSLENYDFDVLKTFPIVYESFPKLTITTHLYLYKE